MVEKTRKIIIDKSHSIAKYYELLPIGREYDKQAHTLANSPTRTRTHTQSLSLSHSLPLSHNLFLYLTHTHINI